MNDYGNLMPAYACRETGCPHDMKHNWYCNMVMLYLFSISVLEDSEHRVELNLSQH